MHATLETSDDRNRLVNHASNREVLQELARHVAQALEIRASPSDPLAALRLLAGVENADPELKNLGFLETLVQECSKRTIFPRLDGKMDLSKNIWQVPHRIWLEVLDPHFFPDVLAIDPEKTLSNLLRLFELPWIDSALLRERLRQQILSMSRAEAGEMVGSLLADGQLRQVGTNGLLIDSKGKLISGSGSFVTPTEKLPALPSWASEIRFLDEDFQNGLLRKSRAGSARLLTSDLSGVDEYRFDTVARALIQQVDKGVEDDSATIIERWREVLRWLLEASTGARQVLPQLAIEVVTTRGTLRRATSCYLGKDYPRGQIASRLYERFGNDEFVASAPENGLGGLPLEEAEEFLLALGVDSMPRPEPFRSGRDYDRFCESVLDRLEYPRQIRGHWCTSPDDLRRLCRDYEIKGISLPDRWLRVLAEGDAVALSAYLLSTGGNLISEEIDQVARFQTKLSGERALWADHSVPIPNATLYFLRGSAWIPSIDGSRHRPSEIMLSSHGVRVLRGVYSRHALDAKDELLASYGGREALESLLTRLGAVSSLEMLSGQSLYELLLTLPERDPNGEVAPGIYRTLLEEGITVDESSHRDKFFESGKMWGRHQGRKLYLPVRRLRYNANLTLTTSIEDRIPLVDIPRRKSAAFVRQLFGVPALSPEEIHLEISIEGTEYDPGSEQANRHLQLSIPYIYALRLGQTLDEQGRAANLLRKAVLRVCNRAQISAVLLGEPPESVVLETPGDRFVIDTSLVVVGEYRQDAPWFLTFWLTVAELVAELLGTDIADEVGGILRCRTTSEMLEVVRVRLGADADAKLTEAQSRFRDLLQETDSDTERSIPSPSPVSYREYPQPSSHASPPIQTPEQSERAPLTGPNLLPGAGATFQPIDGPSSAPSKRRKLVITAMSANPCRGSGPLATEDVTFKVVEAFEEHQGRFPIRVSHLHGDEAFGCDVISVASEDTRAQAIARQSITDGEVLRYIEVKGRSNRRGDLELGENQIKAAELRTVRFFIYRVYVDPHRAWHFELAALSDPLSSNAVRNVTRFDLGEGSGAAWFLFSELPTRQDADEIEASAGES
jgi:hypothetical protein